MTDDRNTLPIIEADAEEADRELAEALDRLDRIILSSQPGKLHHLDVGAIATVVNHARGRHAAVLSAFEAGYAIGVKDVRDHRTGGDAVTPGDDVGL